jgi:uncharacterized protein
MRRLFAFAVLALLPLLAKAGDIPPVPAQYFNDYAGVVDQSTASEFNQQLADFERQTSSQIVVAVYPKLQTDDALDDFCYRTAQAWRVGQQKLNNGAVLFIFIQDHRMRIETGYGLEGALPDITCVRILDDEIAPYFKRGDFAGGLRAGINALIAATKGEYIGTGSTVATEGGDARTRRNVVATEFQVHNDWPDLMLIAGIFLFSVGMSSLRRTQGVIYGSNGTGRYGGFSSGGGGGFSIGGGGGGFSGGGGGGGGFSGGGGSFGGGGASGSW